jgi:ketosteroid isomerase-like protein
MHKGAAVDKADEEAIRRIELGFNEAWGRHDAHGMVESMADDAHFVTVNGAWTKTRAEISGVDDTLARRQRAIPIEHPRDARDGNPFFGAGRGDYAFSIPHLR